MKDILDNQIRFEDIDADYKAFVDKFKPKKTTDDCYTPEPIYQVVADYVRERYGYAQEAMVRPFWPGGDYTRFEYPAGGIVVDNPPFSIISQIVANYNRNGIPFFLFAPYLTCFEIKNCTRIVCDADIFYENGARVKTSFVTSEEPGIEARAEPELYLRIKKAMAAIRAKTTLPKYSYPPEVLTSTMLGYLANHGQSFAVKTEDCYFTRSLENQREHKKTIFGGGFLISERAAAEKTEAEHRAAENVTLEFKTANEYIWKLSPAEREIINHLGGG